MVSVVSGTNTKVTATLPSPPSPFEPLPNLWATTWLTLMSVNGQEYNTAGYRTAKSALNAGGGAPVRRYHVFRSWKWETLALLLCCGIVAALFGVLNRYEGKRLPEWGYTINLSTLIAVLATLFRALVVAVAVDFIAHTKWSLFASGKPRRLRDLHDFDSASRSAWGAVALIPTVFRDSPLTLVAIAVVLLSFPMGPFVQQALNTRDCAVALPGRVALLPVAHYIGASKDSFRLSASTHEVNTDMKAATIAGLTTPGGNKVDATCSTGNCTFPSWEPVGGVNMTNPITHASIGMCSRCFDVGSLVFANLTISRFSANVSVTDIMLPTNSSIRFESNSPLLSVYPIDQFDWARKVVPPDFEALATWGFNFTVLSATTAGCVFGPKGFPTSCLLQSVTNATEEAYGHLKDFAAAACTLYPCLRTYSASVTNGVLNETLLSTMPAAPDISPLKGDRRESVLKSRPAIQLDQLNLTAVQLPCRLDDGTIYTADTVSTAKNLTSLQLWQGSDGQGPRFRDMAAPERCIYRITPNFYSGYTTFLGRMFTGNCTYDTRYGNEINCGDKFWLAQLYSKANATAAAIARQVDDVAVGMTSKMRQNGSRGPQDFRNPQPESATRDLAEGTVLQNDVCTVVDWKWLLLPVVLAALAAVLLGSAVVRSWIHRRERPVWKSTVLPILFYKESFERAGGVLVPPASPAGSVGDGMGHGARILEMPEMEKLAGKLVVRFELAEGSRRGHLGLEGQTRSWETKPKEDRSDVDSLLIQGTHQP